jgi:transcription antitermination factor NusG
VPILAHEPDLHPHDLFDHPELRCEDGMSWWALYCLSRREKQLMRQLRALDVAYYAPLIAKRLRSPSGRVRTSYIPLFGSYVFLYGDAMHRHAAQATSCVSRWLVPPDPVSLTAELAQLCRLIQSGAPLAPESRLEPGMRVRVRSGPFAGFEGTIIRRAGETRLLVAVDFLQQGASVQLDDCQVEHIAQ